MSTFNDGAIPYGSRVLSLTRGVGGAALGSYIAENISLSRPTKKILREDEVSNPTGSVAIESHVTGSCTLQQATSSTKQPRNGDIFTTTFDGDTGAENFYIDSITQAEAQGDAKKFNVNFTKRYN